MNSDFFSGFNHDLRDPGRWKDFYISAMKRQDVLIEREEEIPPVPDIDGEYLFWEMMRASRAPDPWMAPALLNLKKSGKYLLAALSNTVIFPPDHEYSRSGPSQFIIDPRTMFDVFISSAHVGLRKPSPEIYELALREVDKFARENKGGKRKGLGWEDGVKAEEIVFLDDIGENLKSAKKAGFGTIKVDLGRAFEAVEVLEELTGLKLAGDHPKVAIKPRSKL